MIDQPDIMSTPMITVLKCLLGVYATVLLCSTAAEALTSRQALEILKELKGFRWLYNLNMDIKNSGLAHAHYDMAMDFLQSCDHPFRHKKNVNPEEFKETLFGRPCRFLRAFYMKNRRFFDSLPEEAWDSSENRVNRVKFIVRDCDTYTYERFLRNLFKDYEKLVSKM